MKPRSTLFNIRVEKLDTPYCLNCIVSEPVPKLQEMNDIFFGCDVILRVWDEFRMVIGERWDKEIDEISFIVKPMYDGWNSRKVEFVMLSIVNRLWGY